jgi:hypothetical protein
VENLGLPGAHALALSGGENDDGQAVHATPFTVRPVRKPHATSWTCWILAAFLPERPLLVSVRFIPCCASETVADRSWRGHLSRIRLFFE